MVGKEALNETQSNHHYSSVGFLQRTLAGFAERLHLSERFSDLSSGLDSEGGISSLSRSLMYSCPLCLTICAASVAAKTGLLYLS